MVRYHHRFFVVRCAYPPPPTTPRYFFIDKGEEELFYLDTSLGTRIRWYALFFFNHFNRGLGYRASSMLLTASKL